MPTNRLRLSLAIWLVFGLLLINDASAGGLKQAKAASFADPAFEKLWNLTDKPVADGLTSRSFLWGPEPFATATERYDSSAKHTRLVQYFDKGRMELTNPEGDPTSAWYVGSGLLVRDLAAGLVQVGDNTVQVYEPAQIPVAGDSDLALNASAPTYADFSREVLGRGTTSKTGSAIRDTIEAGGHKGSRSSKAEPQIKYAYYVPQSGHNIPAPFWDYFQQRGPVYSPKGGTVTAPLFDWQFLMGYPVTEAYWTTVTVNGKDTEVLVQLYERRVLTYTPSNSEGFQVEMGNVGQHYYTWRYGPPPTSAPQDTSLPDSTGGTVTPKVGGPTTQFHLHSSGYQPNETLTVTLVLPDGKAYPGRDRADSKGNYNITVPASLLISDGEGYGLYIVGILGRQSGKTANLYFRIIQVSPKTPTTPYNVDKSVPPSVNAIPVPAYGPLGTPFITQLKGFYEKDFALDKVGVWLTDPYGTVLDVDSVLSGAFILDETPSGAVLLLGSPPEPGIWALTVQDRSNPAKQSITYIRVTEAPPEVSIGAALNILNPHTQSGLFQLEPTLPFQLDKQPGDQSQE